MKLNIGSSYSSNFFDYQSVIMKKYPFLISVLLCYIQAASSNNNDLTKDAFGYMTDILPAAFGDFNSDELTDLFVIEPDFRNVTVLLASPKDTFFQKSEIRCQLPPAYQATSVIPGDFDGDAMMDFLVTAIKTSDTPPASVTYVFINWGHFTDVNCSKDFSFTMKDEPLVIDFNGDLIADLFGSKNATTHVFWMFSKDRSPPQEKPLLMPDGMSVSMRVPHSHAFVDINNDNLPDLFLTAIDGFVTWIYNKTEENFEFDPTYRIPYPDPYAKGELVQIGQNLFMDLETAGSLQVIVPVCKRVGAKCTESAIYVYADNRWVNLNVSFSDYSNTTWNFAVAGSIYTDTLTLRAADFNNDGYVDLLATLTAGETAVFLLENVACGDGCSLRRTFRIQWNGFGTANRNQVMGTFYDFLQDGIMDVIFAKQNGDKHYHVSAFKNSLDYDANFLKVMVISGKSADSAPVATSLLAAKQKFGTSLPGPKISYQTTNQDGKMQLGAAVQLPQSAHFALYLPYTIFGLGRTPNFIEELVIRAFNHTRPWNQIIPNSQMVIIPYPQNSPSSWKAQLFVTPSKIVVPTVLALLGTCIFIAIIIALLHWKERREDRIEKLQEAHRFHFDAM